MRQRQRQLYYSKITFCILTLILGTLLHFLYEWTGYNYLVGFISPVNESTWEHLKLLFFPVLFLSVFEYFYIGRYFQSFITARTIGCVSGLIFIVVFFYTYTGIIGQHFLWLDIAAFFISTVLCYCLTWYLTIRKKAGNHCTNFLCICFLLFLLFLFIRFTEYPPAINLFKSASAKLVMAAPFY